MSALRFLKDEASDSFKVAVEIHGSDQGFEGIGESGGTRATAAGFLAFTHHEMAADADGNGVDLEAFAGDEA